MSGIRLEEEFKKYLLTAYTLSESDLFKLLDDLNAVFDISVNDYIQKRHLELQKKGMKNPDIYEQLKSEIRLRPFLGPDLSTRQIRRIIYG